MKVYVAYWDHRFDGSSNPVAAFSSQEKAEEWQSNQRPADMAFDTTPEWVELVIDGNT